MRSPAALLAATALLLAASAAAHRGNIDCTPDSPPRPAFGPVSHPKEWTRRVHCAFAALVKPDKHGIMELPVQDLLDLVLLVLSPDGEEVTDKEKALLQTSLDGFIKQEGLHVEIPLFEGYISRGHPLQFMQKQQRRLYSLRRARGHIEL